MKSGTVLERLARCTTLLIDKTGTLTSGHPALDEIVVSGALPADEVLCARGLVGPGLAPRPRRRSGQRRPRPSVRALSLPEDVEEVAGQGIRGVVDGHRVAVGQGRLGAGSCGAPAWAKAARRRSRLDGSLTVFVAVDGEPAGVLIFDDPIRADASRTDAVAATAVASGGS